MRIKPPTNFWHTGDLPPLDASRDPRQETYAASELEIDLRECSSFRPPAILWCAVYALLAKLRGTACRLLTPEDTGAATYLKEVGLYPILQSAAIEVDHGGPIHPSDASIILPVTQFNDEAGVDNLPNQVELRLGELELGSANVRSLVTDILYELAFNAAQHSESPIGAYGLIYLHRSEAGNRFLCAIGDGGIGIRASLKRNKAHSSKVPYDWVAIDLASRERVSGTGDPTRGIGLSRISDEIRKTGRQMVLHSGAGVMAINENVESESRSVTLFPGTLTFVSIPT